MCVNVRGGQGTILGVVPWALSIVLFGDRICLGLGSPLAIKPQDPKSAFLALELQVHVPVPGFLRGDWGSNSDLQACAA